MTPPSPSAAPPEVPAVRMEFARPAELGTQFAKALASGDTAQAAQMAASADPAKAAEAKAVFDKVFGEMGFKIGPEDQVKILGQVAEGTRLSIPLVKAGETVPSLSMQVEVERDTKMGWKVTQVRLPKELEASAAPAPQGGTPMFVVDRNADALSFASASVNALIARDFTTARKAIDETTVPDEKLAGLCIVFEEGNYQLKASKPLIITVANPNVSWVIAQVESSSLSQNTEFGLELQRSAENEPWKVVGLNLSQLLGSFAQGASKLGVPYTPIVQNPKGGESLALYFEYDQPRLHPRAEKQLLIVAEMLKSDSHRKLRITGHTDAKGDDDYNIRLSQARATSVKQQLAALGVSPDQVVTEGLGKASPLSPNQKADGSDDPEGRSKNRRAEIFLDF